MKQLSRIMLSKSIEAFIMALEVYNKPTIQYRIEGFVFFFINSCELLLKTKILEESNSRLSIYYDKKRNQERKTISLRDSLIKVFPDSSNPVRKNIEEIQSIRDKATHFIVPEAERIYSSLFQSGVINYVSMIDEWFDKTVLEKCTPAMLAIVGDVGSINEAKLKKKYGKETFNFIVKEKERLNAMQEEINDNRYMVPYNFKITLTKKEDEADISLSVGDCGEHKGIKIDIPKDPNKTHPYRQKEVIDLVKEKTGSVINQYEFQSIIHKEKIRKKPQYHLLIERPKTHKYSDLLVEFIAEKILSNPEYVVNSKESYKNYKRINKGVTDDN